MKNKTLLVIIILLVVVVFLFLGFWGFAFWRGVSWFNHFRHQISSSVSNDVSESSNSEETTSQSVSDQSSSESSSYLEAKEVQPSGSAVGWDSEVKPILVSVFGGAKLVEYTTATGLNAYLKYILPRKTSSSDLDKVLGGFKSKGYKEVLSGVNNGNNVITLTKNDSTIAVTFENGSNYLEATVGTTPSNY